MDKCLFPEIASLLLMFLILLRLCQPFYVPHVYGYCHSVDEFQGCACWPFQL
jgi:hypothetical protein